MSENLTKLYVTEFSTVLMLKLQQRSSKLRGRCREGFHVGKQASPIQYIGAIQMRAPAGRFAPIQRQDVDFSRRWVFPADKEGYQYIDSFDKLKILQDPTSQYSDVAAAAVAREWDDRLIGAAFASAQIGTDAGSLSSETFNTNIPGGVSLQIALNFGASTNTGCTVQKMIEAKRIFRKLQALEMPTPMTWVTNSQGESDLLNQAQVVSTDFNAKPVLQDGQVQRFMGFDIVYSERLTSSSNQRQNIVFVQDGIYLGIWKDTENSIDRRIDLSGLPWQLATLMSSGATRLEPGRLLQVLCADTSAASDVTP